MLAVPTSVCAPQTKHDGKKQQLRALRSQILDKLELGCFAFSARPILYTFLYACSFTHSSRSNEKKATLRKNVAAYWLPLLPLLPH